MLQVIITVFQKMIRIDHMLNDFERRDNRKLLINRKVLINIRLNVSPTLIMFEIFIPVIHSGCLNRIFLQQQMR